MENEKPNNLSRREVVTGAGLLLAGAGATACADEGGMIVKDRKAAGDKAVYDRGLVPIDRSGWTRPQGVAATYPALETSLQADVVIVGAGLAGSSLALHLAEAGVKVVVLEARQPAWGASGRNAGHVLPILKDLSVFESFADKGKAFLDIFHAHHTITFDLAKKYAIDCDAVRSGYLNAIADKDGFEKFQHQTAKQGIANYQGVKTLSGADMVAMTGTSHFPYGVVYENGGRVNPYLFTNGMISAAVGLGAVVHGDSEAVKLDAEGSRWRVRTAKGDVVADRVVFCTNAYPNGIVPEFERAFYPLTAYGIATKPLPAEALKIIMPGGATLAEVPVDLNPMVKDRHGRLILSSIPTTSNPQDGAWHFQNHLKWIHDLWPQTKAMPIELEEYWTGRVAMRDKEFPGVFEVKPGVFGLMYFNAWGNVMAPLMGKLLAQGLSTDQIDKMPFPVEKPDPVFYQDKQNLMIRQILIPAARLGRKLGFI